jgi:putative membrane protein
MATIGLNFWLTQWNWDPSIVIGTALIVSLYLYAIGPLRKQHGFEPARREQVFAFILGMGLMFLALVSPLDELGDSYLFSAHMVQHLFLIVIGPPLLLIGTPDWFIRPIVRHRALFALLRFLTLPAAAFVIFNTDFFLWHAPALYNATLENENIHILEHMTFIIFGLLFWWPILSPSKDLPRLSIGGQILYLFLSCIPVLVLGVGLTLLPLLYAPYIAAPRVWGISAALDQQLGGLVMLMPGNIIMIIVIALFLRWMQNQG